MYIRKYQRYLGITEALSSSKNKIRHKFVYFKIKRAEYLPRLTKFGKASPINRRWLSLFFVIALLSENSRPRFWSGFSTHSLVWIDQRAQHRSLERSWEIFWQPKWVSVSSVMSRSIRSLQTVYPQWVKIAPHIDATGIRGIIDACVCARVYIYIYIFCHPSRVTSLD